MRKQETVVEDGMLYVRDMTMTMSLRPGRSLGTVRLGHGRKGGEQCGCLGELRGSAEQGYLGIGLSKLLGKKPGKTKHPGAFDAQSRNLHWPPVLFISS
jgi:hypothetical protein